MRLTLSWTMLMMRLMFKNGGRYLLNIIMMTNFCCLPNWSFLFTAKNKMMNAVIKHISTWNNTSLITTLKNFFPWRPRILSMTIRAIKANFVPPIFTASGETHRRRLLHPSNLLELLLLLQNLHQITKELLMVTVPEK